jgi:glutamate synthase (NADPH) large chain
MVSLDDLDDEDVDFRGLVERHLAETGSGRRILLETGDVGGVRKVMPNDYKRVLEATARRRGRGRDVIEAVMEASRDG